MKKGPIIAVLVAILMMALSGIDAFAADNGGALFKQHCAECHPDGGNVIVPGKTLHKKDLKKNGVKTPDDIVNIMRNPGPGMTKFDAKTISDNDARLVAEYIMKNFN
jgi:cytochrome c6